MSVSSQIISISEKVIEMFYSKQPLCAVPTIVLVSLIPGVSGWEERIVAKTECL